MRILWLSALAATLATQAAAQPLVFSSDRAARIDEAMNRYVADGSIAGAVTLVLQNGRTVHQGAYGWADKPAGRRMAFDAIFRIASQSKAITSTAVMMLIEEGRIGLGDPVGRYLPSFTRTTVAEPADSGRRIVPARRQITIRDLLTHTAGISYGTDRLVAPLYQAAGLGPAAGWGWYTADKDEPICTTIDRLAALPFVAQPGTRWVYGYNTDILGCLVERVSGRPLDEFVRTRIFEPLGMEDTYFFLPRDKAGRLAAVHRRDSTGALVLAPAGAPGQGHYVDGPRQSFAGGAGLVSTAADYGRFLQMLLDGGAAPNGTRLLSPTTIRLMTTNQVDTLFTAEGYGFGLGFEITERPGAGGSPATEGSFGWGGAYQSSYSVDPALGLVTIILTQHLPNVPFNVAGRFSALVYQALVPADPR